jgi:FkbM family methyltransferase
MSTKSWLVDRLPLSARSAGRYWYRRALGRLDPAMAIISPILRPGTRAIDAGANNGVYAYFLARAGLRVEAFEPVPSCQTVIAAMPVSNVTLHRVALSDTAGRRELVVPLQGGGAETQLAHLGVRDSESVGERWTVDVTTLDSYHFDDVSIIKIDVEGHELAVLRGARETLRHARPVLYVEIEARHAGIEQMSETFEFLRRAGYAAFFVRSDGTVGFGGAFSVELHQRQSPNGDIDATYVNNFLFAHSSDVAALTHFEALSVAERARMPSPVEG